MKSIEIGARIKSFMKERGLSQKSLAEVIDMPQSVISDVINGKRDVDKMVNLISDNFEVSRDYLITGKEFNEINTKMYHAALGVGSDEMRERMHEREQQDNSGMMDLMEMYAQRLRLVDELRASLNEELSEVRSIKEELKEQRESNKRLQETLHDAISALRLIAQTNSKE